MARAEIIKTPLGERLRRVRKNDGDPLRADFARKLGVSEKTLGNYERGDSAPDAYVIEKYSKELGVNLTWLITGEGEMFADPSKAPAPVLDQRLMRKLARIAIKVNKELSIQDTKESAAEHAAELYNELRVMVKNMNDPEEIEAAMPLLTLTYKRKISAEFNDQNNRDGRRA